MMEQSCREKMRNGIHEGFLRLRRLFTETFFLLLFTVGGFVVMGYHPGFEDDGVYLAAVKADLNPSLYPHDSAFFRLQMQATVFDGSMARFVRWTGVPLARAELFWQFVALFLTLWACRRIAVLLFDQERARWAGVAMVAAMFTLPVAGTALNIADQHLHPRNLATALVLMAVAAVMGEKRWWAVPLLGMAFLLHPIMAALGGAFCAFLVLALREGAPFRLGEVRGAFCLAVPLGWVFAPSSESWRLAAASRSYFSVYRWVWYEWLGAVAPLVLFWALSWAARRWKQPCDERLSRFALAVFAYGVFQLVVAMALLAPDALARIRPLQPMRFLHLVYVFMALICGGLLGRFLLGIRAWRWGVYLLLINGGMFLAVWETVDVGVHLEMPWMKTANPWLQAFEWVRGNTPTEAYFALDPRYLAAPGEGFHGFRALAERSMLADGIKDTAVVTEVPSLAPVWHEQQLALAGWKDFRLADFERLKGQFGVDWVVVSYPAAPGLDCRWHNGTVAVCRVP
jgi:hypothetical protein